MFIVPSISVNVPTPSNVIHPQNTTGTRGPPLKPTHFGRQISSTHVSSTILETCNILGWNTSSCWLGQASAWLEKGWRNLATKMCWFEGWSPCTSGVLGMYYIWWSWYIFSMMIKSGDWDGQFRQFNSFSLCHWTTLWEAWHGALSSWKIYPPFGFFS
jgi:hypothetical protein